jgi:hypothetical protein
VDGGGDEYDRTGTFGSNDSQMNRDIVAEVGLGNLDLEIGL